MPYRVLNNEALNRMAQGNNEDYITMLRNALNNMEEAGYLLVQIEQASDEDGEPYYIFHRTGTD